MSNPSRREFIARIAALTAAAPMARAASAPAEQETAGGRRFSLDLTPGAIGVSGELPEIIRLARAHGFESVQPDAGFLARQDADGMQRIVEELRNGGLRWGAAGLPVDFRRDEMTFRRDLERLPRLAAALREAGVRRIGTWISPGSDDLDYDANMELHGRRLREVAQALAAHGLRLGLEYVGTPSLRARMRFAFVHNLAQARRLIEEIGVPGTGVVLDSWHWWTAGDRAEDLRALSNADVIAVDLNDAPRGVALEDQQDNRRELPAATGVIPVRPFLEALVAIGYDGPVRAEPFNQELNRLDNEEACARTIAALRKAVSLLDAPAAE